MILMINLDDNRLVETTYFDSIHTAPKFNNILDPYINSNYIGIINYSMLFRFFRL